MDFKIRIDKQSNHIITHLNDFPQAIEFIKNNDCNGLQMGGIVGSSDVVPNFNKFNEVADKLIWLSFSMHQRAKKIENFENIYNLGKLKYIYLNDKEKFTIDVSKFEQLVYLGAEYWEGIKNLNKACKLETIVLNKYIKKDLCEFKTLTNLDTLHLYSSKINNLHCVENLKNLKILRLARNQELTDISALFGSTSISALTIEKCKHINRASLFDSISTIKELYIDEIDSLSFIHTMPMLEKLTFLNCKDGDLKPLLKAPHLTYVHFYPNKKHYTYTKEEMERLLNH